MQCYKEYLAISRKVGDQKAEALACNSIGVAYQVRYSRVPKRTGGHFRAQRPPVTFGLFGFLRGTADAFIGAQRNSVDQTGRRPTVLNPDDACRS